MNLDAFQFPNDSGNRMLTVNKYVGMFGVKNEMLSNIKINKIFNIQVNRPTFGQRGLTVYNC